MNNFGRLVTSFALLTACGTDDAITPEPSLHPALQIVAADHARVFRGQSIAIAVTVKRNADANGTITVTAEDLPAGVTAAPITIVEGETMGVLTLVASADIALGTQVTASLRATCDGVESSMPVDLQLTDRPGAFDISFDGDGFVLDAPAQSALVGTHAIARQPDGKIVVAGNDRTNNNYFVARYLPDGTLDQDFGTAGRFVIPNGVTPKNAKMVLRPDGSIIVGTYVGQNTVLYALDSSGKLVDAWGNGTAATFLMVATLGYDLYFESMTGGPDGAIYVTGMSGGDIAIVKLRPDGEIDTNFSGDGLVLADFGGTERGKAIALRPDGRIFVAGYGASQIYLQLKPDGVKDLSFDYGDVTIDFTANDVFAASTLSDGRVAVAAYGDRPMALFFEVNGSYGLFTTPLTVMSFVDHDGAVYGIGEYSSKTAVAKFAMNGAIDTSFGVNGIATLDIAAGNDAAFAAVSDGEGHLYTAGYAYTYAGNNSVSTYSLGRLWL